MTAQFQRDVGKYSTEYIVSTDDLLLGFRGLWNFGADPRLADSVDAISSTTSHDTDDLLSPPINGRVSAGLEMYYGLLNKGGGCAILIIRSDSSVHGFPIYFPARPVESPDCNDDRHSSHGPDINFIRYQSLSLLSILLQIQFQPVFLRKRARRGMRIMATTAVVGGATICCHSSIVDFSDSCGAHR